MKLCDKAKAFIGCAPVWRDQGFNDLSIITHAWHESGGFMRPIGKFNFWGIKRPSVWHGETKQVLTHEYKNGIKIEVTDEFIDFPTVEQAVLWYCDFIHRLYRDAWEVKEAPATFFKKLTDNVKDFEGDRDLKYATDPKYTDKLTGLYLTLSKDEVLKETLKAIS